MGNHLAGWADARIAAGDAATAAGLDPRVGDVVDLTPSPDVKGVALVGRRVLLKVERDHRGQRMFRVGEEAVAGAGWGVSPHDWASACRERGYLVERGSP